MNIPTLEQIIKSRNICAEIIVNYGERYLPIFERLENEIALREKELMLMSKAYEIVSKNGTQNSTQIGTHLKNIFNSKTK